MPEKLARPLPLKIALTLGLILVALNLLELPVMHLDLGAGTVFNGLILRTLLSSGLILFLILKAVNGKNWARYVFLILSIPGLLMSPAQIITYLEENELMLFGFTVLRIVDTLLLLVFLFLPPSGQYFRMQKLQARTAHE